MKKIMTALLTLAVLLIVLTACNADDLGKFTNLFKPTQSSQRPGSSSSYAGATNKPTNAGHTHVYTEAVTLPTCTEEGYTTYTCNCGSSYTDDYTQAFGHNYTGITCQRCGEKIETSEGLLFELSADKASYFVIGLGYCTDSEVVVPAEYEGLPVTKIGDTAFRSCKNIISVTLLDGVISIGESAFSGCSSLKSVILPDSLTSIGGGAFSACSDLINITIPNSVTSIGNSAFSGCTSLTSITIPDNVTSIGDYTFCGCTNLTNAIIGKSVTSIGINAFEACKGLTSIIIPDNVKSIGWGAFFNCRNLTSVTIGDGVKTIERNAFQSCTNLSKLTMGNSVTEIGEAAFMNCQKLMTVNIPASVKNIGSGAFDMCGSLKSVTFEDTSTWYVIKNNILGSSQIDVASGSTNAKNLTGTYKDHKWYKV